jgi:hypothetical protein
MYVNKHVSGGFMSAKGLFYIPTDDKELSEKIRKIIAQLGPDGVYLAYLAAEAGKRNLID